MHVCPSRPLAFALLVFLATVGMADARADDCRQAEACRIQGLCSESAGECVAATDADCAWSDFCRYGKCRARGGRCVVLSDEDCRQSAACQEAGWCTYRQGSCGPLENTIRPWQRKGGETSPMLPLGIVLTSLGGIGILGGLLLLASDIGTGLVCADLDSNCDVHGPERSLAIVGGGLAAVAIGIPLLVVGARADEPEHHAHDQVSLQVGASADGGFVGLTVAF